MTRAEFIRKHGGGDEFIFDLECLVRWELQPKEELMQKAFNLTADFLKIPRCDLSLKRRDRYLADARFCFFRYAREELHVSFESIASFVGFNHSTVLYGARQTYNIKDLQKKYSELFDYLKTNI